VAAFAGWAARRAGLPAVVGYLLVGVLFTPFTPGYIADRHQLQVFADLGVVLLLFEVGIEIDPLQIGRERGRLFVVAPLQVLLTGSVAAAVGYALGLRPAGAVLLGLCLALSSSVVVVNITRSRRRTTDRDTDEDLLGWSVIQDLVGVSIAIVALIALGLENQSGWVAFELALGYVVVVVIATGVLPGALRRLSGEHDLFLVISVASGLVLAGLGAVFFGIPLALAAFVSGLSITESRVAEEARSRLLPFRDVFAVMFFVAMGGLIDPAYLLSGLPWLGVLMGLLLLTKMVPTYLLARAGRLNGRSGQIAVGLAQIGEFSFVLASIGVVRGVIPRDLYTAILASVVLTIAASAVLVRFGYSPRLSRTGSSRF
jgi:CPA2 family monovalent cation:H+ antiporter-2